MNKQGIIGIIIVATLTAAVHAGGDRSPRRGKGPASFAPTVESLRNYRCPEWFRDAKFGIYLHWGAYSVARQGEWYARKLYEEGSNEYQHQAELRLMNGEMP